jgi:hypothetical protein
MCAIVLAYPGSSSIPPILTSCWESSFGQMPRIPLDGQQEQTRAYHTPVERQQELSADGVRTPCSGVGVL